MVLTAESSDSSDSGVSMSVYHNNADVAVNAQKAFEANDALKRYGPHGMPKTTRQNKLKKHQPRRKQGQQHQPRQEQVQQRKARQQLRSDDDDEDADGEQQQPEDEDDRHRNNKRSFQHSSNDDDDDDDDDDEDDRRRNNKHSRRRTGSDDEEEDDEDEQDQKQDEQDEQGKQLRRSERPPKPQNPGQFSSADVDFHKPSQPNNQPTLTNKQFQTIKQFQRKGKPKKGKGKSSKSKGKSSKSKGKSSKSNQSQDDRLNSAAQMTFTSMAQENDHGRSNRMRVGSSGNGGSSVSRRSSESGNNNNNIGSIVNRINNSTNRIDNSSRIISRIDNSNRGRDSSSTAAGGGDGGGGDGGGGEVLMRDNRAGGGSSSNRHRGGRRSTSLTSSTRGGSAAGGRDRSSSNDRDERRNTTRSTSGGSTTMQQLLDNEATVSHSAVIEPLHRLAGLARSPENSRYHSVAHNKFKELRKSSCVVSYGGNTVAFSFLKEMLCCWHGNDVTGIQSSEMNRVFVTEKLLGRIVELSYAQQEASAVTHFDIPRFNRAALRECLQPVVSNAVAIMNRFSYTPDKTKKGRANTCKAWFIGTALKNLRGDVLCELLSVVCVLDDTETSSLGCKTGSMGDDLSILADHDNASAYRGLFGLKTGTTGAKVLSTVASGGALVNLFSINAEMRNDSIVWRNFNDEPFPSEGSVQQACGTSDRPVVLGRTYHMFHHLFHKRGRATQVAKPIFPAIGMTESEFEQNFSVGFVAVASACVVNSFVFENGGKTKAAPGVHDWMQVFMTVELLVRKNYKTFLAEQRKADPEYMEVRYGSEPNNTEAQPELAQGGQPDDYARLLKGIDPAAYFD